MTSIQEAGSMMNLLSENELNMVADYIHALLSKKKEEEKQLPDVSNCSMNTGYRVAAQWNSLVRSLDRFSDDFMKERSQLFLEKREEL